MDSSGVLLKKVFCAAPSNIGQLKDDIREVLESINANALQSVIANIVVRIDECIESGGGFSKVELNIIVILALFNKTYFSVIALIVFKLERFKKYI